MAEPTTTDTRDSRQGATTTQGETTSHELEPVMKAARAKTVTSDVPRRPSRGKIENESAASRAAAPTAALPTTSAPAERTSALRPANVEIYQGGADRVDGDSVSITQGGATNVTAGSVHIRQGGIANAQADDISVNMGGVALARADRISVEMGGMGLSLARETHLTQGVARSIIAQDVRVEQSLVGTALAGRVSFERPSAIFLLLAGKVEGPVQAMLDWRGAIAFGAAFGLVVGLLRRR
jgi:hypothetical protein